MFLQRRNHQEEVKQQERKLSQRRRGKERISAPSSGFHPPLSSPAPAAGLGPATDLGTGARQGQSCFELVHKCIDGDPDLQRASSGLSAPCFLHTQAGKEDPAALSSPWATRGVGSPIHLSPLGSSGQGEHKRGLGKPCWHRANMNFHTDRGAWEGGGKEKGMERGWEETEVEGGWERKHGEMGKRDERGGSAGEPNLTTPSPLEEEEGRQVVRLGWLWITSQPKILLCPA